MIDLSIVVPTLNTLGDRHQQTKIDFARKKCLESLLVTTPDIVPIYVSSNNGSPFPLPPITSSRHGRETRIRRINVWDQGQCKAVNAAVAVTHTEWVMVTNDDMVFPPFWTEKLFENMPKGVVCFSPVLVEPTDGAPTFIKQNFGGAGGDYNHQKFVDFTIDHEDERWETGFNLPFVIKRDVWNMIGGYDVNYDPWGSNSDSDLEYKLKLAGHQPMQNRNALVYHFSNTSNTFVPENRNYWQKNWDYFIQKWGFPRTDDGIWTADFEIPYENLKFKPKWAVVPRGGGD